MPSNVKVLEKRELSITEFHVRIKYKGREYRDNFSLPGYKLLLGQIKDKKDDQYIIIAAMIAAAEGKSTKTAKAEEVSNGSQDNSEG